MARIEGAAWHAAQTAHPESPYGFTSFLAAWHEFATSGGCEQARVADMLMGCGDGMLYGEGGYSRYVIERDGEIVLLASSLDGRTQKRERAQLAGVRVSDEPRPA